MTTAIEIHRTDNCDIYKYQDGHLEYDYKPFRDLDIYRIDGTLIVKDLKDTKIIDERSEEAINKTNGYFGNTKVDIVELEDGTYFASQSTKIDNTIKIRHTYYDENKCITGSVYFEINKK